MSAQWPGDPGRQEAPESDDREPTGRSLESPYTAALATIFWIGFLGGALMAIIAWNEGPAALVWFDLGVGLASLGGLCGVLWILVGALTWKPRE